MISGACARMWRPYVTVEEQGNLPEELGTKMWNSKLSVIEKVIIVQEFGRSNLVLTGKADETCRKMLSLPHPGDRPWIP